MNSTTNNLLRRHIILQKVHTGSELGFLLWSDWVKGSIFEEVIDVVVVDLDVGNENAVTTVFIHILRFTCLL